MTSEVFFVQTHYGYCQYDDSGLIYNLYIEPCYRRKGLARRLLRIAKDEATLLCGVQKFIIEATPMENSITKSDLIKFYESESMLVLNKENTK